MRVLLERAVEVDAAVARAGPSSVPWNPPSRWVVSI